MCGIICCGICTKTKNINTPRNYPNPPSSIICPFCTHKGSAIYKRRDTWFTLFFIPIFPVKFGDPYTACVSCGTVLGRHGCFLCSRCRSAAPLSYGHCVRCGLDLNEDGNRICE